MGCLSMQLNLLPQPGIACQMGEQAKLKVNGWPSGPEPHQTASVKITTQQTAKMVIYPGTPMQAAVNMQRQAELVIGEVCSVGTDTICVLAATDGPLRTVNGGYLLLNPENEQDD